MLHRFPLNLVEFLIYLFNNVIAVPGDGSMFLVLDFLGEVSKVASELTMEDLIEELMCLQGINTQVMRIALVI